MSFGKRLSDSFNKHRHTIGFGANATMTALCGTALAFTASGLPLAMMVAGTAWWGIGAVSHGCKTKAGKAVSAFAKAAPGNTVARVKRLFGKKPGL